MYRAIQITYQKSSISVILRDGETEKDERSNFDLFFEIRYNGLNKN